MSSKSSKNAWIYNALFGALISIFAILVFYYSEASFFWLVILLSIALLLSGIGRIINALSNEKLSNLGVVFKFITGILAIIVAFIVIIWTIEDPENIILLVIDFLAFALLIIGISRVVVGSAGGDYPKYIRILLAIIGVITITMSIAVFLLPTIPYILLIDIIAVLLLLNGIMRVLMSIAIKNPKKNP